MTDLIAKLEAATEGSRELDVEIALATDPEFSGWMRHPFYGPDAPKWMAGEVVASMDAFLAWRDQDIGDGPTQVPRYTASIDDALRLVPGKFHWSLYDTNGNGKACAQVEPENFSFEPWSSDAATPALALCAAILRAHLYSLAKLGDYMTSPKDDPAQEG